MSDFSTIRTRHTATQERGPGPCWSLHLDRAALLARVDELETAIHTHRHTTQFEPDPLADEALWAVLGDNPDQGRPA